MTIKLAFDIPQAADAASVPATAIRRAIKAGELKAKQQSRTQDGDGFGKYLIRVSDLEAWLDSLPDG